MFKKSMVLIFIFFAILSFGLMGCSSVETVKDESEAPKANTEPKFKDVKADYTLKLSLQEPATENVEYISAQIFKNYVEAQTSGKVQIEVYSGAQLGKGKSVV